MDADIFGDVNPKTVRFKPPKKRKVEKKQPPKFVAPKKLKPISKMAASEGGEANLFEGKIAQGTIVEHMRFGKGEVLNIEGAGADAKAEINFENGGVKKLLLRFAKLQILG